MVAVSVSSTLDHVLRQLNEHQYSRLPVYEKDPDHIVGVVHLKDLVQVWMSRRAALEARRPAARGFDLRKVMRQPLFVPETKSLHELVDEFREHHSHMAIVVDEHGSVAGLVTLEDVLEQVFGEIEDEHDISRPRAAADAPSFEVDGMINIPDLANQYGIELPSDDGYETLAGFLLFELGDLPQVGTTVEHAKLRFTVLEMERNRIARVQVERLGAGG
jgi:CBS domain containing-hemolysin-like protein